MIVAAPQRRSRRAKSSATATARIAAAQDSQATQPAPGDRPWEQVVQNLLHLEPEFMINASFSDPAAEQEIMSSPAANSLGESSWKPGPGMPPYLARMCEKKLLTAQQERELFRRMNFAKYRIAGLRQRLDPRKPNVRLVCQIEHYATVALADRDRLVQSNLRLVVSIAKKFADARNSFDDLLSEGISSLMRAVEKFDYERGFRFSTYATQAIRRTLYRLVSTAQRDRTRFVPTETSQLEETSIDESEGVLTEQRWHELRGALTRMLGKLDPRERLIVRCRFGLDRTREVRTLQSLAEEFGVCKERIRQLETRAMAKLRGMVEQTKFGAVDNR